MHVNINQNPDTTAITTTAAVCWPLHNASGNALHAAHPGLHEIIQRKQEYTHLKEAGNYNAEIFERYND